MSNVHDRFETMGDPTDDDLRVDHSRRNLALTLFGTLGASALLHGCASEVSGSPEVDALDGDPEISGRGQGLNGTTDIQWFDNVASMRAFSPSTNNTATPPSTNYTALVQGYATPGDGGGGIFVWSTTAAVDDGKPTTALYSGTIVNPLNGAVINTSAAAGWRRVYDGALNAKWFGVKEVGIDDDALAWAIQEASNSRRELFLPAGTYTFSTTLALGASSGLKLRGSTEGGTTLSFSGSTGTAISAHNAQRLGISHLTITTSASFSGTLVDLEGSSLCTFDSVTFSTAALNLNGLLVAMRNTLGHSFRSCTFSNCAIAVRGASDDPEDNDAFSNCISFRDCTMPAQGASTAWVLNPNRSWTFESCIFESLSTGAANAIVCHRACGGLVVSGCWFGDATYETPEDGSQYWINGVLGGASICGNAFVGNAPDKSEIAIRLSPSSSGIQISGNNFYHLRAAVEFTEGNDGIAFVGNFFDDVAQLSRGAARSGIMQQTGANGSFWPGAGIEVRQPFRARVRQTNAQSVPTGVWVKVSLDLIEFDPNTNFDPSAPNHWFIAPMDGFYQVNAHVEVAQPTGFCQAALYVNTTNQVARGTAAAAAPGWVCCSSVADVVKLKSGDSLELWVLQTSGSSANTYVANMSVHYLSS